MIEVGSLKEEVPLKEETRLNKGVCQKCNARFGTCKFCGFRMMCVCGHNCAWSEEDSDACSKCKKKILVGKIKLSHQCVV